MKYEVSLLDALRGMDGSALTATFDLYAHALYIYILRTYNDPMMADQIVGDVFAKFLDQLAAGNCPTVNLRSYLYQAAYHLLVDEVRSSHRRVPLEDVDRLGYHVDSLHLQIENQIVVEALSQAIRIHLTDYQRHVVILRFLEGFSLYETAIILGKSVNVIKAAQNRAMATLRRALVFL